MFRLRDSEKKIKRFERDTENVVAKLTFFQLIVHWSL